MAQMIDKLQIHILRTVRALEQETDKDLFLKSLLLTTKRELKNLNRASWNRLVGKMNISIEDYFYEAEVFTFTYMERLILFLIFNHCLDKINDELLEVINYFADAFHITGINPINYELYLRMLTFPPIQKLIIDSDPEDLKCESYEEALRILCKINKRPYSPFFFGDYSIQNVYTTIKTMTEDEKYSPFLSSKDIARLELLPRIEEIATPAFRESFAKKVQEVESRFENKKTGLALAIAKLTPSLLFEARVAHFKEETAVGDTQHYM